MHERNGRGWRAVEARALVGAPGTPNGRAVTGELAWLELPEQARRIQPRAFRDRIVAVFGPLPTSLEVHRRLVAAEPLAVIHVDDRLPFTWTKNDGVYPHWARTHGMPPTLTVPYAEGWRWRRDGMRELKVRVEVDLVDAQSQNVDRGTAGPFPSPARDRADGASRHAMRQHRRRRQRVRRRLSAGSRARHWQPRDCDARCGSFRSARKSSSPSARLRMSASIASSPPTWDS